jgi:3-dehydroquinate synthase
VETTVRVELGERSYDVAVVRGGGPERVAALVRGLAPSGVVVVTDATVARLHGEAMLAAIRAAGRLPAQVVVVPGESSKSVGGVERVWRGLLAAGLDRQGLVVAHGGGVVGDLAGFAAATWLRGVRVVHAPTTLLSMVDSAVGGKTGIDLDGKNLVGAFHQPSGVVADLAWLETLDPGELRAGLGEVWKTAILAGGEPFERLERGGRDDLLPVVLDCVRHKAAVVTRDERDEGERASLNLGHTLGHALEVMLGLRHGEAVALGIAFVVRLAVGIGRLDATVAERILSVGRGLDLPLALPRRVGLGELRPLLRRDKKALAGEVRWILPTGLGSWTQAPVPEPAIEAALTDIAPG